jgi:Cystathionine beta-lyase family protein involved in aluminum resistance
MQYVEQAESELYGEFKHYDEIREYNQTKVLAAFQEERISDTHFTNSTGYGYGDIGRDTLDKVYANIFKCEAALVRPHFVNGTHAIGAALFGNLRPGNTMLSICGKPYDTLHNIIGISGKTNIGSLREYGVNYKQIDLVNGELNYSEISEALNTDKSIKLVHIQRSTGYGWRKSLCISEIEKAIAFIKK